MNRVIFLNRFFFPDHSATSQILTDLAFYLAGLGFETHVVTSQQLYGNPDARLPREERVHGVHIHRVPTTAFGRSRLWQRSIDYLSYYFLMSRKLSALVKPGDTVIAMTDPPLISIIAMQVTRRGAYLINWLQDIYPEIATHLNVPFLHSHVARLISILRDQSLKAARANVVVGCQMKSWLLSRKFCPDRVDVIHNWADDEAIQPVPYIDNPLRHRWQLENKFVVGYSGNLGRAHEFDTIVCAARCLRDHSRIVFACIGGGHGFDELRSKIEQHGLQNTFRFFPYQNRNMLKYSLGVADVHWISLKPELEGFIVPSKFYGVAAAGKPIIAISADNGEVAQLVMQHRCGIVIKPGHINALVQIICELADDRVRVAEMGRHARAMLELRFSRRNALESWRQLLESLADGNSRGEDRALRGLT